MPLPAAKDVLASAPNKTFVAREQAYGAIGSWFAAAIQQNTFF